MSKTISITGASSGFGRLTVDVVLVQPSASPTNMYSAAQQPSDPGISESYGEIAEVPGKILKTFVDIFQGANPPNPQDIATAIDKLITTPAGKRPERIVVGLPFGSDAVNEAIAPIQRGLVDNLGLGSLATLKIDSGLGRSMAASPSRVGV